MSTTSTKMVSRMDLNDNKAGMEGLDKERINRIIYEASKGSKFYENEVKKDKQITLRIEEQMRHLRQVTDDQKHHGKAEADKMLELFEAKRDLSRHIVHVDMDAFYAAVEMRDEPSLMEKPMAVGGIGMLSTSNYLARRYGVRAAMPGFIAKRLCPQLVIVPCNFDKYRTASAQIREILAEYDPHYSPMSLDEAYLDVSDHVVMRQTMSMEERMYLKRFNGSEVLVDDKNNDACVCSLKKMTILSHNSSDCGSQGKDYSEFNDTDDATVKSKPNKSNNMSPPNNEISYTTHFDNRCPNCKRRKISSTHTETFGANVAEAVREMRFRIHQRTRLTASAGIAPNLMLAKVSSDRNKPNGQYRLEPTKIAVMDFIRELPIRKISGIGKVSEKMLNALNITKCSHLYEKRDILYHMYSPTTFHYFMRISQGLGHNHVAREEDRKSISVERTFRVISLMEELYTKCQELCSALVEDLKEEELMGKTVTLKIKTEHFEVKTRAQTLPTYTSAKEIIQKTAFSLLKTEMQMAGNKLKLRLMGVRMSNLLHQGETNHPEQRTLLRFFKPNEKIDELPEPGHSIKNTDVETSTDTSEKAQTKCLVVESQPSSDCDRTPVGLPVGDTMQADRNGTGTRTFLCPVCQDEKRLTLAGFNVHLDKCLSRSAISDLVKEENSQASTKRKLEKGKHVNQGARKKRKVNNGAQPLDKFIKTTNK